MCVLAAGFTLASVLKNQSAFQQFLVKNLSLSSSAATLLLNTPVSLREVINCHHYTQTSPQPQSCTCSFISPQLTYAHWYGLFLFHFWCQLLSNY